MIDRTREQHIADVAAAALANLQTLISDSQTLACQLEIIVNHTHPNVEWSEWPEILMLAHGAPIILRDTQEAIRDIASELPIRGMDYGVDA